MGDCDVAAGPSKAISVAPAPTAEYLWPSVPQVGHNAHALYSPENDFEVFIDVSGTTQYYVEVEISLCVCVRSRSRCVCV